MSHPECPVAKPVTSPIGEGTPIERASGASIYGISKPYQKRISVNARSF